MRILIADDSEVLRRAVRSMLSAEAGWEICGEAASGPEALAKAQQLQPDVVLLDINMPGSSGLQTARQMRQQLTHIKILIMSLHDASHFLPTALEAGADGCVDKAQISSQLIAAIKKLQGPSTADQSVDN